MGIFKGLFKSQNEKEIIELQKTADKVVALADKYASMSDSELKAQTAILKQRLADGETTDDILPDAFAVVREAGARVLNMRHFYVQIIGGIILHQGRISEMRTGEGKTLVATLSAYLNALKPIMNTTAKTHHITQKSVRTNGEYGMPIPQFFPLRLCEVTDSGFDICMCTAE